jgi:hypothetical protein
MCSHVFGLCRMHPSCAQSSRGTRLGEFSLIGRLFTLCRQFFDNYISCRKFRTAYFNGFVHINFDKKIRWALIRAIFSQAHLVTLQSRLNFARTPSELNEEDLDQNELRYRPRRGTYECVCAEIRPTLRLRIIFCGEGQSLLYARFVLPLP